MADRTSPETETLEDLRSWIRETYAFWIAGDLPPSHMRKGRSLSSTVSPPEHGRHIPQTSPAPGCDSGSISHSSSAGLAQCQQQSLRNAAIDALAGWNYIREHHGDLYGVGWDRVQNALEAALADTSTGGNSK